MKTYAIITAGGTSTRYGKTNKLLEKVNSKEIIRYTVEAFLNCERIDKVIICANESIICFLHGIFKDVDKVFITEGGASRQESVYKGVLAAKGCDYVLIHDGARPMIDTLTINKAIDMVYAKKALTVAAKTIDTIKQVDKDLKIIRTIDRSSLYNTQTPQAFEYQLILSAHEKFKGQSFTDDAGMVEAMEVPVYVLEGSYKNIKITTKNDLDIANIYLNMK
jgi:2-C-methyl-D-erythritol 4-phosphate cytidylyltransferase